MRRILFVISASVTAGLASLASGQPYGMDINPGYWVHLGRFDSVFELDGPRGTRQVFIHPGFHAHDDSFSTVYLALSYDTEQLNKKHGSYWQLWSAVTAKCGQEKIRITEIQGYNRPLEDGMRADQLWDDFIGPKESEHLLDDQYYTKVERNQLSAAIYDYACSTPKG